MPYVDGKRVSNEEWTNLYGSLAKLHTGPNGDNPASPPELDPETKAPKQKKGAGGKRSTRSTQSAKNAIADALGVKDDSPTLDAIDVSGLDVAAPEKKDDSDADAD